MTASVLSFTSRNIITSHPLHVIIMPTFFQAVAIAQPKTGKCLAYLSTGSMALKILCTGTF